MEKDNVKTASTQDLQKAMEQKQVGATNTGVDPYKKAQSYLKAMLPAITEALPKSKGMDAERFAHHLDHFKDESEAFGMFYRVFIGCVLTSAQLGPRAESFNFMSLYPL